MPEAETLLDTARLDGLAELLGVAEVRSLFGRMIEEAAAAIAAMRRALEAGERERDGLKDAAHRLAGLGGNVGAARLSEFARAIELRARAGVPDRASLDAEIGDMERIWAQSAAAFEKWQALGK